LIKGIDYIRVAPQEVFLQLAPLSFDASCFEIWGALLNGAKLVLAPPAPVSLTVLASLIHGSRVSTLWLSAGLFEQIVSNRIEALRPLHHILTGGDVVSARAAAKVLKELPHCCLINGYGPTESATFACVHRVTAKDANSGMLPIGRPVANTQVYILDSRRKFVPSGVTGEIFIGGDGLAREYINRRELTATQFVEHDFGNGVHERLYRTGDLARYRPDGIIEFLGRADNQIKIRGYRVEVEEVEAALRACPGIDEAVVVPSGSCTHRRLAAYVIPEVMPGPDHASILAHLSSRLPPYMVPSRFTTMESLPLTANGKIDRSGLAENLSIPKDKGEISQPENGHQATLVRIWEETLGMAPIGIDQNFFAIGGDSLLAVCLFAKIEEEFDVNLPANLLFEYPTIAALSKELVSSFTTARNWETLIPIKVSGQKSPIFLVHGLSGDVVNLYELGRHLQVNRPFYALRGLSDSSDLPTGVEELSDRYIKAIRKLQPNGPYIVGGYSAGGIVAFDMACQLDAMGECVKPLIMLDTESPCTLLRNAISSFDAQQTPPPSRFLQMSLDAMPAIGPYTKRRFDFMVAFYHSVLRYRPRRYPGRIFVVSSGGEPNATPEVNTSEWSALAGLGTISYRTRGDHANMLKEPDVRDTALALQRCVAPDVN
jgi:thioesterase domain-containing protein/acyl carrier protein